MLDCPASERTSEGAYSKADVPLLLLPLLLLLLLLVLLIQLPLEGGVVTTAVCEMGVAGVTADQPVLGLGLHFCLFIVGRQPTPPHALHRSPQLARVALSVWTENAVATGNYRSKHQRS